MGAGHSMEDSSTVIASSRNSEVQGGTEDGRLAPKQNTERSGHAGEREGGGGKATSAAH